MLLTVLIQRVNEISPINTLKSADVFSNLKPSIASVSLFNLKVPGSVPTLIVFATHSLLEVILFPTVAETSVPSLPSAEHATATEPVPLTTL